MARPKLGDSETERLHVKITSSEIKAIDDWRFENRLPSRSEAVRRLIQIGLAFDERADDLSEAVLSLWSEYKAGSQKLIDALGAPADNDPDWISGFVVAASESAQSTGEKMAKIGDAMRWIERRRKIMKIPGEFEHASMAAVQLDAGHLVEQLEQQLADYESRRDGEDQS